MVSELAERSPVVEDSAELCGRVRRPSGGDTFRKIVLPARLALKGRVLRKQTKVSTAKTYSSIHTLQNKIDAGVRENVHRQIYRRQRSQALLAYV